MKFRLMYSGELKAAGNNNRRVVEKWAVRHEMNSQLKELWKLSPLLQGYSVFETAGTDENGNLRPTTVSEDEQRSQNRAKLHSYIQRGSYQFLPLVRESLSLSCNLDILFLRKDGPGYLFDGQRGDLDNRLKVLIDGLCVPTEGQTGSGSSEEIPYYCLLEDDKLVTDLSVRTDRLLSRPDTSQSEVSLIIEVTIRPVGPRPNLDFFLAQKF